MSEDMSRRRFVALGASAVVVVGAGVGVKAALTSPEVELKTMRMGVGAMKTLVVYGTKSGCTEGIAQRIGERIAASGSSVTVVPAEKAPDPSGYDAVVVGSGVRAGSWHPATRGWVEANASALKARPVALFTCGLTITDESKADEVRAYTDPLIEATGVTPVDVGLFAGWNEPKAFSFAERTIMKLMKAPQGDFRDWDAIDAWADEMVPALSA